MTGVAGGDIPTMELTAADVGDIADDDGVLFFAAADRCVLVPVSVTDERVLVGLSVEVKRVLTPSVTDATVLLPAALSGR